jgi:hypothetical protein
MECSSITSQQAGLLDLLLADAMSQDGDEAPVADMRALPTGAEMLPSRRHSTSCNALEELSSSADAAGSGPGFSVQKVPGGNSLASLMSHYMQRGRAAQRAAAGWG